MQLQCRPSTPWQASHRHIGLHVCASVKALRPHEAAAARLYQQTTSTAAPKPLCLARVVEVLPGCKGLIAAQQLQPGQAAVLLPSYNSLSVPLSSEAVYLWECEWLEPFERAHGPLPAALVDLLTDHTGFSMPCGELQATDMLAPGHCSSTCRVLAELLADSVCYAFAWPFTTYGSAFLLRVPTSTPLRHHGAFMVWLPAPKPAGRPWPTWQWHSHGAWSLVGADVKGTYQLTTLLLYVRQLAVTATSAGKRSFWADWLRLLPGLDHDTAPFGAWQHEELLLLRYQPYKVWCSTWVWWRAQKDTQGTLHVTKSSALHQGCGSLACVRPRCCAVPLTTLCQMLLLASMFCSAQHVRQLCCCGNSSGRKCRHTFCVASCRRPCQQAMRCAGPCVRLC
jgi:hypothetical protein